MGESFWPYGIEPNRAALAEILEYSYEQGLAKRRVTVEEMFDPSTLSLAEEA
ncbi:MAG: hypothetical protein ACR2N5_03040 [Solirubrobacterales bacterium]